MSRMMEEIRGAAAGVAADIRRRTRDHAADFKKFASKRDFRLIVLVARGTSDNAALFGRYLLEITTGIPVSLCAPSVHTVYGTRLGSAASSVIGISQSGEGTDVNWC